MYTRPVSSSLGCPSAPQNLCLLPLGPVDERTAPYTSYFRVETRFPAVSTVPSTDPRPSNRFHIGSAAPVRSYSGPRAPCSHVLSSAPLSSVRTALSPSRT